MAIGVALSDNSSRSSRGKELNPPSSRNFTKPKFGYALVALPLSYRLKNLDKGCRVVIFPDVDRCDIPDMLCRTRLADSLVFSFLQRIDVEPTAFRQATVVGVEHHILCSKADVFPERPEDRSSPRRAIKTKPSKILGN